MDPLRIVVRVVFAYAFLLVFTRLSGHRTVQQSDVPSFVIAMMIGDMVDDLLWAEVSASVFVVAVATLFLAHMKTTSQRFHSGSRIWRRAES